MGGAEVTEVNELRLGSACVVVGLVVDGLVGDAEHVGHQRYWLGGRSAGCGADAKVAHVVGIEINRIRLLPGKRKGFPYDLAVVVRVGGFILVIIPAPQAVNDHLCYF